MSHAPFLSEQSVVCCNCRLMLVLIATKEQDNFCICQSSDLKTVKTGNIVTTCLGHYNSFMFNSSQSRANTKQCTQRMPLKSCHNLRSINNEDKLKIKQVHCTQYTEGVHM